jgi:hypothetical protein
MPGFWEGECGSVGNGTKNNMWELHGAASCCGRNPAALRDGRTTRLELIA